MKRMVVICLLIISCISFGQNLEKIDSLNKSLSQEKVPIHRAKTLFNIAIEYLNYDKNKCELYLNRSEKILRSFDYTDELLVRLLNVKAGLYQRRSEFETSDSIYDLSIHLSDQLETDQLFYKIHALNGKNVNNYFRGNRDMYICGLTDIETMSENLDTTILKNIRLKYLIIRNKGIALASTGRNQEAIPLFMKDLNFQRRIFKSDIVSYKSSLINSLNNAALCLNSLNDNDKALELYFEALDVETSVNPSENINRIYLNISGMFMKLKKYDKAIEYARKINSKEPRIVYGKNTNIGMSFNEQGLYREGIIYLDSALFIAKKSNLKQELFETYRDLGLAHQNMDNYDKSLLLLTQANKIFYESDLFGTNASVDYSIGLIFLKKNDYTTAIKFFLNANKNYQTETSISDTYILNTEKLYESYKSIANEKDALLWLEKLYEINNKYIKNNKEIEVAEIETKYQTKQKENEILRLKNENNEKKAALAQSRLLNLSGVGVLILVLGIGFFFWQQKKQQLKVTLLENSIQAAEMEKRRIGKELHDGIAGRIIKLVKDTEYKDLKLSDQLLGTYNEVRRLSHQLDNTPIHNETFVDRLIDLIPQDHQDKNFSMKISPVTLELKEPIGNHLFRIIQELIANNLKHAQANQTNIFLNLEQDILSLNYEDNGIGIKEFKKGNGFENMENRLALMNGKMQVITNLPQGLKVEIRIPYIHEKD